MMGFLNNLMGDGGIQYGGQPWVVPNRIADPVSEGARYTSDAGSSRKTPAEEGGGTLDALRAALDAWQGSQPGPPRPPHAPDWAPMPQPRFRGMLNDRVSQPPLMPTPPPYAPYMMRPNIWGAR